MPDNSKHIAIFCNPNAGNGNALLVAKRIIQILQNKPVVFSAFIKNWPSELNLATEAWIVGGDGTLNYFINKYPQLTIPLAIFKGGTGNDFYNFIHKQQTVEEQVENTLHGKTYPVDAAVCNGQLFINGVGVGFDGAIVKDLLTKGKNKVRSSYLYAILKNIFFYKEKQSYIGFDDQQHDGNFFMINILNGQSFGGGFKVAPKASLSDGKLDLNIVGKIAPLKRLYYVSVIKKGHHIGLHFIKYHHVKKIEIQSVHLLPAHMDGEFFSSDRFVIECLPDKFSFIW